MYTGIIQGLKPVLSVQYHQNTANLEVPLGPLFAGINSGGSIAVNGVCLTVASCSKPDVVGFDISGETLQTTNLKHLQIGDLVNLERPVLMNAENGGHNVSGHVIGTIKISQYDAQEDNLRVRFACPPKWLKYIFHKGFVALDGASLTVSTVDFKHHTFTVDLIPETRAHTSFGYKREADWVNLEIDSQTQVLVDTTERFLSTPNLLKNLSISKQP